MKLNDISSYLDVTIDRTRAIFFDLDGTLLDSNKEISDDCIQYLKKLKKRYKFHFGIASGRDVAAIMPTIAKYELQYLFDVVVSNNGSDLLLFDEGKDVALARIPRNKVEEILQKFSEIPGVVVYFHNPRRLFTTKITNEILEIKDKNREKMILNPLIDKSYELPSRICIFAENSSILDKIKMIQVENVKGYHSEPLIYEFVQEGISKSYGILSYMKRLKKDLSDVLVFGDGNNDVEMLQDCQYGIAMKNGTEAALQVADEITEYTNNQEGIIRFFKKYIKEDIDGKLYL